MATIRKLGSRLFHSKKPSIVEDHKEVTHDSDRNNSAKDETFSPSKPSRRKVARARSMNLINLFNPTSDTVRHSTASINKTESTPQCSDVLGLETPNKQKALQDRVSSARSWSRKKSVWTLRRNRNPASDRKEDLCCSLVPAKEQSVADKSDLALNLGNPPAASDASATAVTEQSHDTRNQSLSIRQVAGPTLPLPSLPSASLNLEDLNIEQKARDISFLACNEPREGAIPKDEIVEDQINLKGDPCGHSQDYVIDSSKAEAADNLSTPQFPCCNSETTGDSVVPQKLPMSNGASNVTRPSHHDDTKQVGDTLDDRRTLPSYLQAVEPGIDSPDDVSLDYAELDNSVPAGSFASRSHGQGSDLGDFSKPTSISTRPTSQECDSSASEDTPNEEVNQKTQERAQEIESTVGASPISDADEDFISDANIELQNWIYDYQPQKNLGVGRDSYAEYPENPSDNNIEPLWDSPNFQKQLMESLQHLPSYKDERCGNRLDADETPLQRALRRKGSDETLRPYSSSESNSEKGIDSIETRASFCTNVKESAQPIPVDPSPIGGNLPIRLKCAGRLSDIEDSLPESCSGSYHQGMPLKQHTLINTANDRTSDFLNELICHSSTPLLSLDGGLEHIVQEQFRKAAYKTGGTLSDPSGHRRFPRSQPFGTENFWDTCLPSPINPSSKNVRFSDENYFGYPGCQIIVSDSTLIPGCLSESHDQDRAYRLSESDRFRFRLSHKGKRMKKKEMEKEKEGAYSPRLGRVIAPLEAGLAIKDEMEGEGYEGSRMGEKGGSGGGEGLRVGKRRWEELGW